MANQFTEAATSYIARGWRIIPIVPETKRPLVRWRNGPKEDRPSGDAEQIKQRWKRFPGAHIGILTGRMSNLVVIDVDSVEGHGVDGFATIKEQEATNGELPLTLAQQTPSRGVQYFFKYPANLRDGESVKSRSAIFGMGCGVDSRADGGLVVAPPSTRNGGAYEWVDFSEVVEVLPSWILNYIIPKPRKTPPDDATKPDARHSEDAVKLLEKLGREFADDYDRWLHVGMALHGIDSGESMLKAWDRWSEQSPKYKRGVCAAKWATFNANYSPAVGFDDLKAWAGDKNPDSIGKLLDAYKHTDIGNAERFIDLYGLGIRWSNAAGCILWTGKRWEPHRDAVVRGLAIQAVRTIHDEANRLEQEDPERAKKLREHAGRSEHSARIHGLLDVARGVAANRNLFVFDIAETFDTHPMLLNVANGTIDLTTGKLRPHSEGDHLTKLSPVVFDPTAKAPVWQRFLSEIFAGNTNMIEFTRRSIGLALTGSTAEQCLWFLHGRGANGKSTFIDAVSAALGDYAMGTATDTLMVKRGDSISNYIARLRGARFVAAKETEEGRQLSEALVKELTGGDTMTARFLRREFFDFKPECKLFLTGNHKPTIRGTDDGIWRRIHLVDFGVTIPKGERDGNLPKRLRAELPGILRWAVDGCLAWQRDGLSPPRIVQDATDSYRRDMDLLGAWLAECCIIGEGYESAGGHLYECYSMRAKANGQKPLSGVRFARQLEERGFDRVRKRVSVWYGVDLTEDAQHELDVFRSRQTR